MSRTSRSALLGLILAAAAWGVGTVVTKRAVDEIPPLVLLPIQLAASLAVLATLARLRPFDRRQPSDRPTAAGPAAPTAAERRARRVLARLGILNPGLAYALSLLGLAQISASLSVVLWALEPILIVLLAALALHERIGARLVGLSAVAVAGMVLVAGTPALGGALPGVLLTVAGVASCAVYTVAARRWLPEAEASTVDVVGGQQAWALAVAGPLAVLLVATGLVATPASISPAAWLSAVGSGVLYYGVAYWLYLGALRHVPASLAASSFYLVPVFGVGAAMGLLGERLEPVQWAGAAAVLIAVAGLARQLDDGLPAETVVVAPR